MSDASPLPAGSLPEPVAAAYDPADEFSLLAVEAELFGIEADIQPGERIWFEAGDGGRLSGLRWGSEPPELVLLHGSGLNAHTWDRPSPPSAGPRSPSTCPATVTRRGATTAITAPAPTPDRWPRRSPHSRRAPGP